MHDSLVNRSEYLILPITVRRKAKTAHTIGKSPITNLRAVGFVLKYAVTMNMAIPLAILSKKE